MSTSLVVYFSATGTTKNLAQSLASATRSDLFPIEPEQPYTPADLDWTDAQSRTSIEMQDASSRPAIANKVADMAQYDTIYLGFPIWWYESPTIVRTFLEQYDLTGKTIVPFATSGSSEMGTVNDTLAPSCPGAHLLAGKRFEGDDAAGLAEWVASLAE